jgi:hypothetical protein
VGELPKWNWKLKSKLFKMVKLAIIFKEACIATKEEKTG